jgi:hypothetical protein
VLGSAPLLGLAAPEGGRPGAGAGTV